MTQIDNDAIALPAPVRAFIQALNTSDAAAILDVVAGDAVINDQMQEFSDRAAITGWIDQEVIGRRLRVTVVAADLRYNNCRVQGELDGKFDKRGLPDPLMNLFYFSMADDKIVQLIILRMPCEG